MSRSFGAQAIPRSIWRIIGKSVNSMRATVIGRAGASWYRCRSRVTRRVWCPSSGVSCHDQVEFGFHQTMYWCKQSATSLSAQGGAVNDARPGSRVRCVGQPGAGAGSGFHQHPYPEGLQGCHRVGTRATRGPTLGFFQHAHCHALMVASSTSSSFPCQICSLVPHRCADGERVTNRRSSPAGREKPSASPASTSRTKAS